MAGKYAFLGRSMVVWLIIIAAETMNGAIREIFVTPVLGIYTAKLISFASAVVIVTLITHYSVRWIGVADIRRLLTVGFLWSGLTLTFEIILAMTFAGLNWDQVIADLNPISGGLMTFGLVYLIVVPVIAQHILAVVRPEIFSR